MAIPRQTRVILNSEGGGPRREFCLSRPVALLLAALFLLVVVAAGLLAAGLIDTRSQRARIVELEQQLEAARTEALTARILKAELEKSRLLQRDLMKLLGMAPADSADTALADTICDVAPAVPVVDAADAGPPPSRWPAIGVVIREFARGDPARGVEASDGIVIAGQEGSRVVAAAAGDVDFVGEDEVLGKYLEIRHGLDWVTIYGHCASINVGPGHRVRAGEQVAKMGLTGGAATARLQFQVWHLGEAVDPRKVLSGEPAPR